ncbi:MAG: hypothetical protein GF346_04695 [Candidatus Eisenbacteria bacterium]|nr:hypothetical protein [Candidatus Latescibacterota bacterium]MBD3301724.1 hypothetical protein [Candidatus Eisenbacteria bacterium]
MRIRILSAASHPALRIGSRLAGLLAIALSPAVAPCGAAELLDMRTGVHDERFRIVLDVEGDASCAVEEIPGTDDLRIVGEPLCPTSAAAEMRDPIPFLRAIQPSCEAARLSIRLVAAGPIEAKSFWLDPSGAKPARFVVDVSPSGSPGDEPARPVQPEPVPRRTGDWRILIDPGHGGRDPGATARGLKEKEIVLDVSRRLEAILDRSPGFEARLTRTEDRFIGLVERRRIAEGYEADAFVSVHANAVRRSQAKGVEVYFLSLGGASDEAAKEIARLENEADPEYVVEEDAELTDIPFGFDLRQNDTIVRSSRLAEVTLVALEESNLSASRGVKQAGFAVLKSFQVPSVLVEVGFISNPAEARRLKTADHRQRLAETIAEGIVDYFRQYARARAEEVGGGP